MQNVLVHIDAELGPIGAWSYHNGTLRHFYPASLDPAIPARARDAMAARNLKIPVDRWFTTLARRTAQLDDYRSVDVHDDIALPAVVAEFRRAWKQPGQKPSRRRASDTDK